MKKNVIKHLKIELQPEPPAIKVPAELAPVPMTAVYFGVRGSGKSTAIQSLLRKYKQANLMDRLFIISPTYKSNSFLFSGLLRDNDDVYEDATQKSLDAVIAKVQQEASEWKMYEENKVIFDEYKRQERLYLDGEIDDIEGDILNAAIEAGVTLFDRYPEYKFPGVQRPQMWLILDDVQSSSLFNSSTKVKNNLNNVLIKTRHIGGERFGINVIIALQNFKLQSGGISKALRMNTTCMALFGYRDPKLIDDIHKEISREISKEDFMTAFDDATSGEKFNHLFIEFGSKPRLRKNFDEIYDLGALPVASDKILKKTKQQQNGATGNNRDGGDPTR